MIQVSNISFKYPGTKRNIFDNFSLDIEENRIYGLLGKNGTGKSTLLYIISGLLTPSSGMVSVDGMASKERHPALLRDIFIVPEEFELPNVSLKTYIKSLLPFYPNFSQDVLGKCLHDFELPDFEKLSELSMGQKKKVYMSVALAANTRYLLMDEPTNHIDNETVQLLEEQLKKYRGAIVMVTHDRYFLNSITHKIAEVDRGSLFEYDGSYSTYLEQKAQREADAEAKERKNRTLYRRELEWIRRGARARGTKSKDRIERFHELENREKPAETEKLQLQSVSSRLGKKTIELENISKSIDGKNLISDKRKNRNRRTQWCREVNSYKNACWRDTAGQRHYHNR